jgi:bifunctional non-homologous end joining protein LigD
MLAGDGDDMRQLSLSMRKTNLARLLARRTEGIFAARFEQGEIGPDLFRAACNMGLEGLRNAGTVPIVPAGRHIG